MDPQARINEAHGLWELCVVRLVALIEGGVTGQAVIAAIQDERDTFANWKRVSRECGA